MVARGLCAVCYALRRQDRKHYAGLRETVLDRDGRRCRVCDAPGGRKGSLAVHHRVPGRSELDLMISLCPACHAKVTRTGLLHHGREKLHNCSRCNGGQPRRRSNLGNKPGGQAVRGTVCQAW